MRCCRYANSGCNSCLGYWVDRLIALKLPVLGAVVCMPGAGVFPIEPKASKCLKTIGLQGQVVFFGISATRDSRQST
jgi:hypothetical protein